MRTINIDLTKNYNNPVFVGYEGEHNQTMLNIKIPDDIINELYTYRVMFETSLDEKYTLEPLGNEDDSIISTYLNANVTKKGILYIQVEAFQTETDENTNDTVYTLIGKTIKMPLLIKESVGGEVGSDEDISADKIAQLEALIATKQGKETGKGLSTNDFTDNYKSKIETNEYNDIFNIRVEWDREYMPHFELIRIYYQYYESGRLAEDTASYNVKDITNGDVYLYKNTSDQWAIAVGTPPSSYHRLPMLVGRIATKTVNGESVKLFFRNGDDEKQFDKLNSEKWELIDTITVSESVTSIAKNVDGNGNALELKGIRFYISFPADGRTTASTLTITTSPNNGYTSWIGRLYRQNIIGRTQTNVFHQNKIENGYWYESYEISQGVSPVTAITYRSQACNDASIIPRINANTNPLLKSWRLECNTIPIGTDIKVYGIK